MTTPTLREAAQAALDAMNAHVEMYPHMDNGFMVDARRDLTAALAEPQQCEYRLRAGVVWDTSCGINSVLPMDAGKRIFCFHCGKPIKFVRGDDE